MFKNIVTFLSPGTFASEATNKDIESWDVSLAMDMAKNIVERHGAKPYGFIKVFARKPMALAFG